MRIENKIQLHAVYKKYTCTTNLQIINKKMSDNQTNTNQKQTEVSLNIRKSKLKAKNIARGKEGYYIHQKFLTILKGYVAKNSFKTHGAKSRWS